MGTVKRVNNLGNLFGGTGGSFAGTVFGVDGLAPTLNTCGGGVKTAGDC